MRLALMAFGTRGDITPFVALGIRLRAEGHEVVLTSHREFESMAAKHGLEFRRVSASFQDFIATSEGRRALGVPRSSPFGLAGLFNPFLDCAEEVAREAWTASEGAQGIVTSGVAFMLASAIAARRGVPLALGQAVPFLRTRFLPQSAFPPWPLGRLYNRLTYVGADRLIKRGAAGVFARWQLETARLAGSARPQAVKTSLLVAASPHVVPHPSDWPTDAHVTGFWWLPQGAGHTVPAELEAFIDAGPPPLCLGFGSMGDDDPDELRTIVSDVLDRLRLRAVVVGGSGSALFGFGGQPNVCEIPFVSYDWLFPRVRAVVHQGGAGTASFCLTAGIPQVIVRYCLDHTFWAWRMHELGVAPPGLARHTLTRSKLETAIRHALENAEYRRRAAALAPAIRAEDGLGYAVRVLGAHFSMSDGSAARVV